MIPLSITTYVFFIVIVITRTWALYGRELWVVVLLSAVFIGALAVQTVSTFTAASISQSYTSIKWVAVTSIVPIVLPPGVKGCLMGATANS